MQQRYAELQQRQQSALHALGIGGMQRVHVGNGHWVERQAPMPTPGMFAQTRAGAVALPAAGSAASTPRLASSDESAAGLTFSDIAGPSPRVSPMGPPSTSAPSTEAGSKRKRATGDWRETLRRKAVEKSNDGPVLAIDEEAEKSAIEKLKSNEDYQKVLQEKRALKKERALKIKKAQQNEAMKEKAKQDEAMTENAARDQDMTKKYGDGVDGEQQGRATGYNHPGDIQSTSSYEEQRTLLEKLMGGRNNPAFHQGALRNIRAAQARRAGQANTPNLLTPRQNLPPTAANSAQDKEVHNVENRARSVPVQVFQGQGGQDEDEHQRDVAAEHNDFYFSSRPVSEQTMAHVTEARKAATSEWPRDVFD